MFVLNSYISRFIFLFFPPFILHIRYLLLSSASSSVSPLSPFVSVAGSSSFWRRRGRGKQRARGKPVLSSFGLSDCSLHIVTLSQRGHALAYDALGVFAFDSKGLCLREKVLIWNVFSRMICLMYFGYV